MYTVHCCTCSTYNAATTTPGCATDSVACQQLAPPLPEYRKEEENRVEEQRKVQRLARVPETSHFLFHPSNEDCFILPFFFKSREQEKEQPRHAGSTSCQTTG